MASICRLAFRRASFLLNRPAVVKLPETFSLEMGKKDVEVSMDDGEEEESVVVLSPIANPLAKDKLVKKILKLVKAGELCRLAYSPLHFAGVSCLRWVLPFV